MELDPLVSGPCKSRFLQTAKVGEQMCNYKQTDGLGLVLHIPLVEHEEMRMAYFHRLTPCWLAHEDLIYSSKAFLPEAVNKQRFPHLAGLRSMAPWLKVVKTPVRQFIRWPPS